MDDDLAGEMAYEAERERADEAEHRAARESWDGDDAYPHDNEDERS